MRTSKGSFIQILIINNSIKFERCCFCVCSLNPGQIWISGEGVQGYCVSGGFPLYPSRRPTTRAPLIWCKRSCAHVTTNILWCTASAMGSLTSHVTRIPGGACGGESVCCVGLSARSHADRVLLAITSSDGADKFDVSDAWRARGVCVSAKIFVVFRFSRFSRFCFFPEGWIN